MSFVDEVEGPGFGEQAFERLIGVEQPAFAVRAGSRFGGRLAELDELGSCGEIGTGPIRTSSARAGKSAPALEPPTRRGLLVDK